MPEVFEITNFSKGYDDSITPEMADPESTQDSRMVDYSTETGALVKDVGERTIGASATTTGGATYGTAIYGLSVYGGEGSVSDFYPLDGPVQRIYEGEVDVSGTGVFNNKRLIVAGGKPYQYCAGDQFIPLISSVVFSSITTDIPDITHFENNFFITGGYDKDIREWDGLNLSCSTNVGLGSSNASVSLDLYRAKTCDVFKDRLFLGNMKESADNGVTWSVTEHRLRYSAIRNTNVWDTTDSGYDPTMDPGYIDCGDKGDEIVRLYTFGDTLLVFFKNSLQKIVWTGGDFPFERSVIDRSTVGNAPWSMATIPEGVLFLNEEGIQITDGNTVQRFPADKKVTALLKKINRDAMGVCFGVAYDSSHEYWLSIPVDGSDYCNRVIVYNWKFDTWKIRVTDTSALGIFTDSSTSGTWEAIENYYGYEIQAIPWSDSSLYPSSKKIIMGREDGYLREKSISYSMAGDDYEAYHTTPWLDFGLPGINKEVTKVQMLWKGIEDTEVAVKYKADSDSAWTALTVDDFGETGIAEQAFLCMRRTGRKFKFRFENNNAHENFAIYKMKVFYNLRSWR
jgi:hypothetical protein